MKKIATFFAFGMTILIVTSCGTTKKVPKKNETQQDLTLWTVKLQNEFKVRWGIPLIPVFPLTLVASLYFGDIYFALIRLIVMGKLFF